MNPEEQLEQVQSELLCSICCDYFIRATTMSCSHTFCFVCIKEWKKYHYNCPICRQQIRTMAPSRALDNMVTALNVNRDRDVDMDTSNGDMDSVTFENMNDDSDAYSIESNGAVYISDDNLSNDFDDFSQDILSQSSDDVGFIEGHLSVSPSDSMFDIDIDSSSESEVSIDMPLHDDSDTDSVRSRYSLPLTSRSVTIKHTIEFLNR